MTAVNRKNSIVADRDGDQAAAITESFVSYARHAVANLNGGQTAAIKENLLSYARHAVLAEKLVEPTKNTVMSDEEIREGLTEAFQQLEEVKAGKRKTRKAEELLYEL